MKIHLTVILICIIRFSVIAQNIEVVTLNKLTEITENPGDSIFFINFWATWCKPCIEEMPDIEKIVAEYRDKKVSVLLVNIEQKEDIEKRINPFLQKQKLSGRVLLLDEPDPNDWIPRISEKWTGSIPATLIKTKTTSEIFEKKLHYQEMKEILDKHIK